MFTDIYVFLQYFTTICCKGYQFKKKFVFVIRHGRRTGE
ncbi:hypothetical protein D1AOALGA4SA_5943 [Olavius algarvensis Delta 1 endosymbiont]|nr:hypothetical protein D1AOALGA4SA_5943 [Olavius algarvensis Delta 1 endosymbiont]